jgi:hypothetical protein
METEKPKTRRIVKEYNYCDENGDVLFQCVRYDPKDFSQRHKGPNGWIPNIQGVRRVLYHLPQLLDRPDGSPIWIVEGEKDVETLERHGLVATCNPMGAGVGKWKEEFNEFFKGETVYIIPDNDSLDPKTNRYKGLDHANAIKKSLSGVAASTKIVKLPKNKDVSEWLDNGGTINELERLATVAPNGADGPALIEAPAKYKLISFGNATNGEIQEPDWLVTKLIAERSFTVLWSEGKAGKTFFAIDLGARIAGGMKWHGIKVKQGVVIHLVLEGQSMFPYRLLGWKVMNGYVEDYYFVNLPVRFLEEMDVEMLISDIKLQLRNQKIALIIVDTVARAISGGNENSPEDMGGFVSACDKFRDVLSCSVLALHHCGHDKSRGRGHTSLNAAADLVLKMENVGNVRTVSVDYGRDVSDEFEISFKLELVQLDNGMTIPVCEPYSGVPKKVAAKLHGQQSIAMQALDTVIKRFGFYDVEKEFPDIPAGMKLVKEQYWVDECTGPKYNMPDRTFRDCRTKLVDKGIIGNLYCQVWKIDCGKVGKE